MGQNGGAVFLVIYLTLILSICFIPLMAELYMGKMLKKECIGAYEGINKKLKLFGFLNPFTGVLISSFYFVVGGWIINYIYLGYKNIEILNYGEYFSDFVQSPFQTCSLSLAFLFICIYFTSRGIKKGIEFANNLLMPLFALILIMLIIFSLRLPNAEAGLVYMFKPDFTKINAHMFLAALGQALFTLSIGMGALFTYGSYITDDKSITKSAYTIILSDTLFALLAGVMIFPAIFSFGLEPNSGAGLVFVTLPYIFSQIPYGAHVSAAFFILLMAAAITSGISILEVPMASIVERYKWSRAKAGRILFIIIGALSILASLSFGVLSDLTILKKSIFDFLDFITSSFLMPLNALVLCIIAGWVLKIKGNLFIKNKLLSVCFDTGLKFVVPFILLALIYIGIFKS
jgi:NSS family neurotransmitter:Na+ symporter